MNELFENRTKSGAVTGGVSVKEISSKMNAVFKFFEITAMFTLSLALRWIAK